MSSPKVIESLTPEQEAQIDVYYKKWLAIGMNTKKLSRAKAKAAVLFVYKVYEKEPPKHIIFVDSPEEAIKRIVKCEDGISKEDAAKNIVHINWWSYWVAFYDYLLNVLFPEEKKDFQEFVEYSEHVQNLHCIFPYDNVCFVVERPKAINVLEADGKPHKDGGLALEYRDGTGFCALNGIVVPDYIALTAGAKLSAKKVIAETNVDVRREGLAKIPMDKVLKSIKARLLDKVKGSAKKFCYELLEIDLGDKKRRALKMFHATSGKMLIERVPDEVSTVKDALAFRDSEKEYVTPEVLT